MNCADAGDRLLELVYDEGATPDRVELLRHVEQCRRCSQELEALRKTRDALNQWRAPSAMVSSGARRVTVVRKLSAALMGAAAMLALSVCGVAVLGTVERGPHGMTVLMPFAARTTVGDEYLLLLYSGAGPRGIVSPDDMKARVAEYGRWAEELERQGMLIAAEKLDTGDTRRMRLVDGDPKLESVAANIEGAVASRETGFFHIRAASREQAEQIAANSPHLKYGGNIGIRRIQKTN